MSVLVLDAGALIALERSERAMRALVEAAYDAGDISQLLRAAQSIRPGLIHDEIRVHPA